MREEDDEDSRRGGAEVTRRRRRRRGRPGVCAAQSHGEEIVVIIYFILLVNLLSTQHPPPVSLPSPTQLASSIVDVRCHRSSSLFSSSSHFVVASKSHVAPLVESFVHTMHASKQFSALLRTRYPLQLIHRHSHVRPSLFSLAPIPLATRMDLAANTMAESLQTSSSRELFCVRFRMAVGDQLANRVFVERVCIF